MEPQRRALTEPVRRAHAAAVAAGELGYLDPDTGFFVFTEVALRAQGTCCGRGCRHCPYGTLSAR